jgi:hypothetical protein
MAGYFIDLLDQLLELSQLFLGTKDPKHAIIMTVREEIFAERPIDWAPLKHKYAGIHLYIERIETDDAISSTEHELLAKLLNSNLGRSFHYRRANHPDYPVFDTKRILRTADQLILAGVRDITLIEQQLSLITIPDLPSVSPTSPLRKRRQSNV